MPFVSTPGQFRTSRWRALVILVGGLVGCSTSSNRFQYSNARRRGSEPSVNQDRPAPPAYVVVPQTPAPRTGGAAAPTGIAREEFLPPPGRALDSGSNPPAAAPPLDPPRSMGDYAGNRTRFIETPRPGERGSGLTQAANGPELAGRVVNAFGRPEPGVSIQVVQAARTDRVVAEVASAPDGSFRVNFLDNGVQYRLTAAVVSGGRRLVGSTMAVPPDMAVVIQLDREDTASFSAIGNRLAPTSSFQPGGASHAQNPLEYAHGKMNVSTPQQRDNTVMPPIQAKPAAATALDRVDRPVDQSPIVSLTALTFDGRPQRLGDLSGRLILLDFFASWCGPCRRCVPSLNNLHRRYAARGLNVVGMDCESGDRSAALALARRTASELRIEYSVLVCPSDEPSPPRDYFQIQGFPTLILLDQNGRVLFRHSGGDQESFRRLESIIASSL